MMGRRVLKIGGSLLRGTAWRGVMAALAQSAPGPLVIVPGGGVYADAVRSTQAALGFDDAVALEMAVLAMATLRPGSRQRPLQDGGHRGQIGGDAGIQVGVTWSGVGGHREARTMNFRPLCKPVTSRKTLEMFPAGSDSVTS